MASASDDQSENRNSQPTADVPNWTEVPFDVGCARCGHDLHGLTEPQCPSCKLTFDWSDAVPIQQLTCIGCGYHLFGLPETRCPECGASFTWEAVLAEYHRKRLPLIEYCWRKRPIRSFLWTCWLALRPRKLWRMVDLHDPPQPRALLVSSVAVFVTSMALLAVATDLIRHVNQMQWGIRRVGSLGYLLELPGRLGNTVSDVEHWYRQGLPALLWICSVFAALMIFRESMRRCRVRTPHVLRVWAYSIPFLLPSIGCVLGGWYAVALFLDLAPYWRIWNVTSGYYSVYRLGLVLIELGVGGYVAYSLRIAYRDYLRLDHSVAVAVASLLVGTLLTLVLCDLLVSPDFTAWRIMTILGANR